MTYYSGVVMARLSERRLRVMFDLLKRGYELQSPEEFVEGVITEIPKVVPCDLVVWVETRPEMNGEWAAFCNQTGFLTEELYQGWKRLGPEDPRLKHIVANGAFGVPFKISDFLTRAEYHRTALYSEWYRKMSVEDAMGLMYSTARLPMFGVAAHREEPKFTEEDRLVLTLLAPHIEQARLMIQRVAEMRDEIGALADALQARKDGVILLGPNRRARLITERARHYVEKYFGKMGAGDQLPDVLDAWVRKQENLSQQDSVAMPQKPLTLNLERSQLKVTYLVHGGRSVLILSEKTIGLSFGVFGLTQRESEVLWWVSRGKSNKEIGTILNTSPRTVNTHLDHIFQKLGVENRTAAAAMALSAARKNTSPSE